MVVSIFCGNDFKKTIVFLFSECFNWFVHSLYFYQRDHGSQKIRSVTKKCQSLAI